MVTDESKQRTLIAKVGLMDFMIHKDPAPYIFDSAKFEMYAPKKYLTSPLRETDEVYHISELVLIDRVSGMRIHYMETENYFGDETEYKLQENVFIITLQNKKLEVDE